MRPFACCSAWGRLTAAVPIAVVLFAHPVQGEVIERRVGTMGTVLEVSIGAPDRAAALRASEGAVRAIEGVERRLSTWRDDSELSTFNRAPTGSSFAISEALASEISSAQACWSATGGYFDPSVGALVRAYDLRGRGKVPSPTERRKSLALTGTDSIVVRQSPGGAWSAVKNKSGVLLEEGGFGKGAGLDAAIASLSSTSVTGAVLDFGGQVAVLRQLDPVSITIADPDRRGHPILAILMDGGSLSVSGNSEKSFVVRGVRFGHLLNPKNGEPVPDFGSSVVWSERGVWADCLSTALYAMGPEKAEQWALLHPEHKVLLIERTSNGRLRVTASDGYRGRLQILDRRIDLKYMKGE